MKKLEIFRQLVLFGAMRQGAHTREVVIPYDRDLGPVLFEHYGADTARRVAEQAPMDVLEIAAGTGTS